MAAKLPNWYQAFKRWRDKGGLPKDRPKSLPKRIPAWIWEYYKSHLPQHAPIQETFWHQPAGFIADIVNIPATICKQEFPYIKLVIVEVGIQNTPKYPDEMMTKLNEYRSLGYEVAGWANPYKTLDPAATGRMHGQWAKDLQLQGFCGNLEEEFDVHGDWSQQAKLAKTSVYYDALRQVLGPTYNLACTTTGLWAGDHAALRAAKCVLMPQAFTGENGITVDAAMNHAIEYSWEPTYVKPLVQVYQPRPDQAAYQADAEKHGVTVIPYILESCEDDPAYVASFSSVI